MAAITNLEHNSRIEHRIMTSTRSNFVRIFLLLLCSLPLAGCYRTDREVIPSSLGEVMPYLYDSALVGDNKTTFSRVGSSKDYRFREETKDAVLTGTFRVMLVKEDIYAVQTHHTNSDSYDILFFHITPERVSSEVKAVGVSALARRHNVALDEDDKLSGSTADMLAFVKAHRELKFTTPKE